MNSGRKRPKHSFPNLENYNEFFTAWVISLTARSPSRLSRPRNRAAAAATTQNYTSNGCATSPWRVTAVFNCTWLSYLVAMEIFVMEI
jgi:hypothetical protein